MFGQKDGKPVDVLVIEHTKIDGKEVEAGTVIKDCEALLAMDLAAGGKVRLATKDAVDEWKRNQAAADKAAKARADEAAQAAAAASAVTTAAVATAVAEALKAAGIGKA